MGGTAVFLCSDAAAQITGTTISVDGGWTALCRSWPGQCPNGSIWPCRVAGAHGAFTWGVLDCLLEDEGIEIAAISGTSAGALNGAA